MFFSDAVKSNNTVVGDGHGRGKKTNRLALVLGYLENISSKGFSDYHKKWCVGAVEGTENKEERIKPLLYVENVN